MALMLVSRSFQSISRRSAAFHAEEAFSRRPARCCFARLAQATTALAETPARRPRRASEATVRTRSHWAASKSGRYEHSGSGRQKVRLDDCRKRLLVLKVGAVLNFLGGWDRDGRLCPESHGAGGPRTRRRPDRTARHARRHGRDGPDRGFRTSPWLAR